MPSRRLADATPAQLDRLVRPLLAARVFPDEATLRAVHGSRPWAIQSNQRGDVAVLDRWRDHLDLLAIEALWSPHCDLPDAIRRISRIAGEHGFTGVVSPPVLEADVPAYEAAGLVVRELLETLELPRSVLRGDMPAGSPSPQEISIRIVGAECVATVLEVDMRCFEPFWSYDRRLLDRFAAAGALAVAERDGACLGYTLCTVDRGSAVLGRLCVDAQHRRRGVGTALLRAAVARVREIGADHMTLSTQSGNTDALALYRAEGFRLTGRRYAFLTLGSDRRGGEDDRIGALMGD